ncbi:mitochondrial assembly of ribosomal large subunit protein 1 [Gastrophryne carolinensis]
MTIHCCTQQWKLIGSDLHMQHGIAGSRCISFSDLISVVLTVLAPAEDLPEFNINVLVNLLRQENAKDLCVIKVPPDMKYVEYFVIVGGTSPRHLQAMAQYTLKVYKYLKQESDSHVHLEGKETDDWMCIDFGDIVVHFMLPETRETYQLEKLWTLRSHDDLLSQMEQEILPSDFTFGLHQSKE